MKKILFTLVLLAATLIPLQAQHISIYKSSFGGYKFYQNERRVRMSQISTVMEDNPEAYKLIEKARVNNVIGGFIGGVGGYIVGSQIGNALAGQRTSFLMGVLGTGLILGSIPISRNVKRNSKKAVDLYNADLEETGSTSFKPNFSLTSNGYGIGLQMQF